MRSSFACMMSRSSEMPLSVVLFRFFISSKDSHRKSRDRLISASSDSQCVFPLSAWLALSCLRYFVDCLWLIVSACYLALFCTQLQPMSWLTSDAIVCRRSVQVNLRIGSGQRRLIFPRYTVQMGDIPSRVAPYSIQRNFLQRIWR